MGHECFLCGEKQIGGVVPTTCQRKNLPDKCSKCIVPILKTCEKCYEDKNTGEIKCLKYECDHYSYKKAPKIILCKDCESIKICNSVECYCNKCWESLFNSYIKSDKVYYTKNEKGEFVETTEQIFILSSLSPKCPGCSNLYIKNEYEEYEEY